MKLYYAPALCSLSPHIALQEAGIDVELVKVDIKKHLLEDGSDFYAINPKGYVPALQLDDGSLLTEGPAIVQYIADLNPAAGIAPANGTPGRYRLQEWLGYLNSELHKSFSPLFKPTTPDDYKALQREAIGARFDYISSQLQDREYLLDRFSVADGYLFALLNWCKWVGIDRSKWPVLEAYVERVGARPAVQAALRAEGVLK